jgi:hypothetical protein
MNFNTFKKLKNSPIQVLLVYKRFKFIIKNFAIVAAGCSSDQPPAGWLGPPSTGSGS